MVNLIDSLRNIVVPLLFFAIDTSCLQIAHTPLLQTLSIFILIAFLQPFFSFPLLFYFLLLTIFSCISKGLALPYTAFIGGIILLTRAVSLYTNQRLLLCVGTTFIITFGASYTLAIPFSPFYTIISITGNLIALYFSLKWFSAVKRGNRS